MIITIDGPVATGKSTIAKKVANILGFIYFDTGAMYRAFTYLLLKNKVNFEDRTSLSFWLSHFDFNITMIGEEKHYFLGKEDITEVIRKQEVTALVSTIAALPYVREQLVKIQRNAVKEGVDAVFEGRDMGTVVFPRAELKIFLTATPEVRAQRRLEELQQKFPEEAKYTSFDRMLQEVNTRDALDMSRETSPLRKAADAKEIDTSSLTLDEVVLHILDEVKSYIDKCRPKDQTTP